MSFQIIEILERQSETTYALVTHANNQFPAIITGRQAIQVAAGESFQAEIKFDGILDWKIIADFDDTKSSIWQEQDGTHLLGRIHSVLDYGDGKTIIDVYMQNGPEFFNVDLEAVDDADLEGNAGLEITVDKLYLFPTDK